MTYKKEEKEGEIVEGLPPSKEMIQSGLAALRLEQDQQAEWSLAHPRSLPIVAERARQLLETYPEFAAKAFYAIPYEDKGRTTWVKGPSVKAAVALAKLYGNQANGARILGDRDDRVIVQGIFIDYETNSRYLREWSIPKMAWSRDAKAMVPLRGDRLNTAVQAGLSKACRNAILAGLPEQLVEEFYARSVEIAVKRGWDKSAGGKPAPAQSKGKPAASAPKTPTPTVEERLAKMQSAFLNIGVTKKELEAFLEGLEFKKEKGQVLEHMAGLYNAIREKQTSVDSIFRSKKAEEKPGPKDAIDTDDLFGDSES